jgi:hypothetical protein
MDFLDYNPALIARQEPDADGSVGNEKLLAEARWIGDVLRPIAKLN